MANAADATARYPRHAAVPGHRLHKPTEEADGQQQGPARISSFWRLLLRLDTPFLFPKPLHQPT